MPFRIPGVIAVALLLGQAAISQSPPPKKRITTQELETQVEVIGPLGVPLGKLVEIEGVAETRSDKADSTWLAVDTVDGKTLQNSKKVEYRVYSFANVKRLEDGKRLKLNVYQEMGMKGLPEGVIEQTVPISTNSWQYSLHTWIVIVNQTAPRHLKFRNAFYDSIDGGHPFDAKDMGR